ncbi:SMI1/KNR4 family protein [Fodinicola feengrottensis]|uniref:SMI1/KNR4 family protein n=1 Tax=Fodinicola feengrottensis TaxID=435914 RepID=A0ABN2GFJ2_9ACTN|nr:SMI1/KNR4 family protein [Fodinicola feengrottensis]
MSEIFTDSEYYTGPELTDELVSAVEQQLQVRLPGSYVELLSERNGGSVRKRCIEVSFPNSWTPDHIEIEGIFGLGGRRGIDSLSDVMIKEWEYPRIGVVLCDMPSGGHDAVMLDYSVCGSEGEPTVAYIDEDRVPRQIAKSFADFLDKLTSCERFRTDDT